MPSQCPVSHEFNPLSSGYMADPFPAFAALREQAAVSYVPQLNVYAVSRYAEVERVLLDRETFSSLEATSPFLPVCEAAKAVLASGFPRKPTFTNCDAPRHTQMRGAAVRCMTPKRWNELREPVRAYAVTLVSALAVKPVADIRDDLAVPLPIFAAARLLGFPISDMELIKSWCNRRVALTYGDLSAEDQVVAARDLVAFWDYCRRFVRSRAAHPEHDLTSDLLALSAVRGEEFTQEDIINMVYSMSLASHETSTAAILNGLQVLLADRAQWDALCADPSMAPGAAEEMMRFNSPTVAIRRTATRDTELGGVPIPRGARLFVLLAAANRDPEHFGDADSLDIRRKNAREHLSFGKAWHFCLGAPLARIELQAVLELLSSRLPHMRLIEPQSYEYQANILLRIPEHLLVHPLGHA
jgi:cytochrome P450